MNGANRDGQCRSRARCPRSIHGRGPPVTRAAVDRRWAARAMSHESRFTGIGAVGVSFPPVWRLGRVCPPFDHRAFVTWGPSPWTKRGQPRQAPCPARDGTGPVPYLSARHLRRVDQPDLPPADVQKPRPRCRHLAHTTGIRIPTRRRRPPTPTVEPQPRTRPVQHHRRNPLASLPVVLAHVQQHVRQRPAPPLASASPRGGSAPSAPRRGGRTPGSRTARNARRRSSCRSPVSSCRPPPRSGARGRRRGRAG